jgi:hypothetical protein
MPTMTSLVVAYDFVNRQIMPLQRCSQPAWEYFARGDCSCLSSNDLDPGVLAKILNLKFMWKIIVDLIHRSEGVEGYCETLETQHQALMKTPDLHDIKIKINPDAHAVGSRSRSTSLHQSALMTLITMCR